MGPAVTLPSVLAGVKLCGAMNSLGSDGTGFGYSPGVSALVEFDIFGFAGYRIEGGYGQSRLPVEEGEIRADFLKGAMYASVRFSRSRTFTPYLAAGAYLKKTLSSSYVDTFDGSEYRFDEYYRDYTWGLGGGAGLAVSLAGMTWFTEVMASRSMTGVIRGVESNVALLPEAAETEIQAALGVKFLVVDGRPVAGNTSLRENLMHGSRHESQGKKIGK